MYYIGALAVSDSKQAEAARSKKLKSEGSDKESPLTNSPNNGSPEDLANRSPDFRHRKNKKLLRIKSQEPFDVGWIRKLVIMGQRKGT